jgi:hypothetical protein
MPPALTRVFVFIRRAPLECWGCCRSLIAVIPLSTNDGAYYMVLYQSQYFGQNSGSRLGHGAIVTKLFVIGVKFFQAMPLG